MKAWAFHSPAVHKTPSSVAFGSGPVLAILLAVFAAASLPTPALDVATAALGAGFVVALSVAVRSARPQHASPRADTKGVLILGREDLAAKVLGDLASRRGRGTLAPVQGAALRHSGMTVDPLELKRLVREEGISRIVVAEPALEAREEITAALLECRLLGVEVEDAVEFYQRTHGKLWLEALDPDRLVFSKGFRITPTYLGLKRALDVMCAVAMLVLAAPVMALVALAIKLESPGRVLFRQERVGQFGRTFTLFKFRSMREDAERDGPTWARENDDRVTRVGRVIRRFHLDELPQAINVLRGDLSFVGPRPERPCFVEALAQRIGYYHLRLYVKPGITGWAQVCYPYADSIEDSYEKLQYDLYYARNVSLTLDVRILFRTAMHVLGGRGR
jgi:exopolysaccharide biosynthesis polyprenyl glycosylphosphotransferase